MILDFFILLVGLISGGLIWHFTYTWYKEREWTKNNPDEYKRIQNNCRDYCEKYLNYKFLETLVKVKLEEK